MKTIPIDGFLPIFHSLCEWKIYQLSSVLSNTLKSCQGLDRRLFSKRRVSLKYARHWRADRVSTSADISAENGRVVNSKASFRSSIFKVVLMASSKSLTSSSFQCQVLFNFPVVSNVWHLWRIRNSSAKAVKSLPCCYVYVYVMARKSLSGNFCPVSVGNSSC